MRACTRESALSPLSPCPGSTRASFAVATKKDHRVRPGEGEVRKAKGTLTASPFSRRRSRWEKVPDRADEGMHPRVRSFSPLTLPGLDPGILCGGKLKLPSHLARARPGHPLLRQPKRIAGSGPAKVRRGAARARKQAPQSVARSLRSKRNPPRPVSRTRGNPSVVNHFAVVSQPTSQISFATHHGLSQCAIYNI
jgi:hypothetical protein